MTPLAGADAADRDDRHRETTPPAATRCARAGLRVTGTSRLVYDIAGRGFVTLRGQLALENPRLEIGSTLNPSLRFFVFDRAPNMARLIPTWHELPLPAPPVLQTASAVVDRLYRHALQRPPTAAERKIAEAAIADPRTAWARIGRGRCGSVVGDHDDARVPVDPLRAEMSIDRLTPDVR